MMSVELDEDKGLHAYIDNELSESESRRLLARMDESAELRERLCRLRHTKDWVRFSFAGERAPTRELPRQVWLNGLVRPVGLAASLLLAVFAFAAGWFGHGMQSPSLPPLYTGAEAPAMRHVIVHIGESNVARLTEALDRAEAILRQLQSSDVQVEIVANAGGLDLVRTASSPHMERIQAMMRNYNNVRFIACANGLKRLRGLGQSVDLISGVYADKSAGDHLIQRLTEGWTYIKI